MLYQTNCMPSVSFFLRNSCGESHVNRELKHATFLSHGRQPEVYISQARTLGLSQIFKVIVSASAKRLENINVVV